VWPFFFPPGEIPFRHLPIRGPKRRCIVSSLTGLECLGVRLPSRFVRFFFGPHCFSIAVFPSLEGSSFQAVVSQAHFFFFFNPTLFFPLRQLNLPFPQLKKASFQGELFMRLSGGVPFFPFFVHNWPHVPPLGEWPHGLSPQLASPFFFIVYFPDMDGFRFDSMIFLRSVFSSPSQISSGLYVLQAVWSLSPSLCGHRAVFPGLPLVFR